MEIHMKRTLCVLHMQSVRKGSYVCVGGRVRVRMCLARARNNVFKGVFAHVAEVNL